MNGPTELFTNVMPSATPAVTPDATPVVIPISHNREGWEKMKLRRAQYTEAANDGDADAQHKLACLYVKFADEWKPKLSEILDLFTSAAAKGHLKSQRALGYIYAQDIKRTIPTSPVDIPGKDIATCKLPWAIYYYNQGSNQGDPECWIKLLELGLTKYGIDGQLLKHDIDAIKYHARCAAQHPSERFDLGVKLRDLLREDDTGQEAIMKVIADMAHEFSDIEIISNL